jgi:transcription factor Dp-1
MMVCQKVEEKGTTTYNEVADELVKKVVAERRQEDPNGSFDQKNIRRRVYDALNVLMAMDIISKQKKEITWKGLPTAAKQDMDSMSKEIEYRQNQIQQKKEALRDLLTQQVCFRNLVQRNHQREQSSQQQQQQQQQAPQPPSSSSGKTMPDEKIPLPFIVVNTNQSAVIQCDMSRDRTEVMFDFSLPFEINDDNTILKKLQM